MRLHKAELSEPREGLPRVSGTIFSILRPKLFETLLKTCDLVISGDSTAVGAAYFSFTRKVKAMAELDSRRLGASMGTGDTNLASFTIQESSRLAASMPESYQALPADKMAAFKQEKIEDMTALKPKLEALRGYSENLAKEVGGYGGNPYRWRWQSEATAAELILKDWLEKGGAKSEADIARHCVERTRAEM